MKTLAIEDFMPYLDETPITEQTFIDFEFKRNDVSIEEGGQDEPYYYYDYSFGQYNPSLLSTNNFDGVFLLDYYDFRIWRTVGELKLIFMLFLKE